MNGIRPFNEQFDEDSHLNEVIPKPWGYEYRAYVDDFFDFWALHVNAPHGTSMHVHPRKLTYLLCLAGQGVTSTLSGDVKVEAGTILRIAPGAFHSTRNTGDEPLELIEVEAPRNKFDLIRLSDDYNRAGTSYESVSLQEPEHPMRRVPYLPHARMRGGTPDGRFLFDIRTGTDIFYRRRPADVFYIPLCLSGVVHSHVEILTSLPEDDRRPQVDKFYLSVTRKH
ncbi:cupin domain-containing protein [Spongiactinospora sp. TRM90649]|uniref:cupin domain-containing protein n=1 Tax=Spongiactinospora sp. TRM90649 TaxID=3031114 RepID=UPI0023F9D679|nr:cupin domain-containing protein [Spongiactinospora sp. TRM90649]MDF5756961.1 cupin domain-containing protein [Spongiactinospora sp. TRM90649]